MNTINKKKQEFESKLGIAKDGIQSLNVAVQTYDDILGFVQVNTALANINRYLKDIDKVISRTNVLDVKVQKAIEEGLAIINSLQPQDTAGNSVAKSLGDTLFNRICGGLASGNDLA